MKSIDYLPLSKRCYTHDEDYQLDIMIGEGPAARSIKLDLPPLRLSVRQLVLVF